MTVLEPRPQLAIEPPPQHLMLEGPQTSTALVSYADEKRAWNELRQAVIPGVEPLPHHDSLLTADQAKRINEYFDIELNFGTHGFGLNTKPEGMLHMHGLTTQLEYEEAKRVVDGLQEGDTLFLEGAGFFGNPQEPLTTQRVKELETVLDTFSKLEPEDAFRMAVLDTFKIVGRVLLETSMQQELEQRTQSMMQANRARRGYLNSAWTYAAALARSKGVKVRYADADYYDEMKLQQLTGKDGQQLMMSSDPADKRLFMQDVRQRDKKSRNIVKDCALDNLPPEGTPPPTGRKPKLSVLFGFHHTDHMTQIYKELGLDVRVNELAASTPHERAMEHAPRDLVVMLQQVIKILFSEQSFMPDDSGSNAARALERAGHR